MSYSQLDGRLIVISDKYKDGDAIECEKLMEYKVWLTQSVVESMVKKGLEKNGVEIKNLKIEKKEGWYCLNGIMIVES